MLPKPPSVLSAPSVICAEFFLLLAMSLLLEGLTFFELQPAPAIYRFPFRARLWLLENLPWQFFHGPGVFPRGGHWVFFWRRELSCLLSISSFICFFLRGSFPSVEEVFLRVVLFFGVAPLTLSSFTRSTFFPAVSVLRLRIPEVLRFPPCDSQLFPQPV